MLNGSIVLTPFFLMSTSWKGLLASAYLSFVLFFGMKPFLCSFFQTISSLLCKYILESSGKWRVSAEKVSEPLALGGGRLLY